MSKLSPFHTELLDFLQKEADKRIGEEGFSLEEDPQLREFQKALHQALSPTSTEHAFPLSEILESYQHLFEMRGPIHVERKLLEAFSKKEFTELGLEREFPKIYRGLPRLYRRDQPGRSYIKKNFTHLPTLIRLAVEKAVVRLYEHLKLPKGAKLALFTWVIPDGLGDFRAAAQTLKKLKSRFPELQVEWIALVPEKYSLPEEPSHVIRYEKECPISLFHRKALEALSSADFILQFPTYYPHTPDLIEELGKVRFHSIGEYGFLESSWFHPRTGNRSMGLHFLEKGILIPETYREGLKNRELAKEAPQTFLAGARGIAKGKTRSEDEKFEAKPTPAKTDFSVTSGIKEKKLTDLENKELLRWIFGSRKPTAAKAKKYLATRRFYLAYLSTVAGGTVYLHALFKSLEEDRKNIDLCMPDLHWLIQYLERGIPILERDFGIRAIEVYFGEKVHTHKIQRKGKLVRIFSPQKLSHDDFQTLLHLSGEFVAVRGNQSFSEAVSANKAFFYDGREHARYFLKDLLAVAENRIGAHPKTLTCFRGMAKTFLHNLPPEGGDWVDEVYFQEKEPLLDIALEIGSALKSADTFAGFEKFHAILKEEYSFEDFLYPFILRELCHVRHPEIAQYEETHLELFSTGACSFTVLVSALRDILSHL